MLAIIGTTLAIPAAQAAPPGLPDIPVPADNLQACERVAYLA
jgi:hypothetical protein